MRENIVETSAVGIAEKHGWESRKVSWVGRRNAPDRLFMHAGKRRSVWIEFKRPKKEAETRQVREADRMLAAGMEVHCGVDSILDALLILDIPLAAYLYLEPGIALERGWR